MQAVTPSAPRHQSSGEFVNDDDFAFLDHVFDITLVKRMRAQTLIDVVEDFHIVHIGKIIHSEQIFTASESFFGQRDGAVFFIDLIVDIAP